MTIPGAIRAEELSVRKGLTAVLYGHPGSGKTKTAAGLRDYGTTLFLDCEGGSLTLGGLEGVLIKRITEWQQLEETARWLIANAKELDINTVVIDTLSALQRMGLTHLMMTSKTPDLPNMNDYGRSNEQLGRVVRRFADMSDTRVDPNTGQVYFGWNVVFICHLTESKDEITGALVSRPSLTPKAAEITCGIVDLVGLVTMEPGLAARRVLVMENWNNAIGKVRQPASRPAMPTKMQIPNTTREDGTEDETIIPALLRVVQHMRGEINLAKRTDFPELFPSPTAATAPIAATPAKGAK